MSPLAAIRGSALWLLLCLAALALVLSQLVVLFQTVSYRRFRLSAALNLLFGFALHAVLMDCAMAQISSEADRALIFGPVQMKLFALPWAVYALLEALSGALLTGAARRLRKHRRSALTPDAIREAVNLLPEGLCISAPDGTVLLSNLRMNALCHALFDAALSNAALFCRQLRERGEEQNGSLLLRAPDGSIWLFTQKELITNTQQFHQLTAVDVTERYRIIEQLREKHDRLTDIQRRMRAVSALSGDMFVAREKAVARAALHNQLGQVLLMGQHYLEHPQSVKAEIVAMTTARMNAFLLGETQEPEPERMDALQSAMLMAESIGVAVTLQGKPPQDAARREPLAFAIQECAANAVKHAGGDALRVEIADRDGASVIRLRNNGRPPKGPVAESGGLLSLRRRVEETGGRMAIRNEPSFLLTLELPKERTEAQISGKNQKEAQTNG